jgi:serine phosphatase RsbU (regulator of sigma subunit)
MSMIGMTVLNHLVNYEHIDDPALILSRLDAEVCDLLIYNNHKEQRFEGMDTAVISIDLQTSEMKFSSAQRPIILMRKGEAITYKGNIYPIGEYYDSIQKIFTNTSIQLEEDDIVYMFSDGYTSQFEESGVKKFNYKRFRKLLTDINHRPLKEQPIILHRTFEAWKGDADQIDDIMVIGFKYSLKKIRKTISAKDIIDSDF